MEQNIEIETRFIGLEQEATEKKLKEIGAEKVSEHSFREWIFAYEDWVKGNRRLRVRTDGKNTWMTYKANETWTVDSTEEIEIIVSSKAEDAIKLIKATGIPQSRYQEKKLIKYKLNNTLFELNFWPKIPMVFEIEAPTKEEVMDGAKLMELNWDDAIFVDQKVLHKEYYNIDLDKISDYRFEN